MDNVEGKVALITGANAGIGKEVARQLALSGGYRTIYLACRNPAKATVAKRDLETATGKAIFEIVIMDMSNLASVRAALSSLSEPLDDLVMNAGGLGGKTPLALTPDGVTEIFASNVLGHVVLLDGLLQANRLRRTALFVASDAARGFPKLGMKRPHLTTWSADEFASLCDGTYFLGRKVDGMLAYGQVKFVGAMWMASIARRHPNLKLITISPGNTRGTEGSRDYALPLRLMITYVLMPVVAPLFGLAHNVDQGAKRLVDGLTNDTLQSGRFYGSAAHTLTGPVIDQSEIFPDLANNAYQDNANDAVHSFI